MAHRAGGAGAAAGGGEATAQGPWPGPPRAMSQQQLTTDTRLPNQLIIRLLIIGIEISINRECHQLKENPIK